MSIVSNPLKVPNIFGEQLDVVIQGKENSNSIIIFVHGFGTDKNEGLNFFEDIAQELQQDHLILRYDGSGFGKSEGNTKTFSVAKGIQDFHSILNYVREKYPNFKKQIIAHSMGMYYVVAHFPLDISLCLFTGLPNTKGEELKKALITRIQNSGGKYIEEGISTYKRSSGLIQEFSSDFFKSLEHFDGLKNISYVILEKKKKIKMFKPLQDEIVTHSDFSAFKELLKDNFIELNGDHNFSNKDDREVLIGHLKKEVM